MSVGEVDDPVLYARVQEQNLLRQYELLTNCIEIGLAKGIEAFDKYTLWSLNAAACRTSPAASRAAWRSSPVSRRAEGQIYATRDGGKLGLSAVGFG